MTTASLLYDLGQTSRDFMEHATETDGLESVLMAEFSQRIQDLHDELDQRLVSNGLIK